MKLAYVDNTLCVEDVQIHSDEPKRTTVYWPIGRVAPNVVADCYQDYIGRDCRLECNGAVYVHSTGYHNIRFELADGAQTKPCKVITEPIPSPKTRKGVVVRYRQGRWEKYLQSAGWVAA